MRAFCRSADPCRTYRGCPNTAAAPSSTSVALQTVSGQLGLASLAHAGASSSRQRSNPSARQQPTAVGVAAGPFTSNAPDALAAAAATTEALLAWMQQQGCTVEGVQLDYNQGPQGQVWRELKASKVCEEGCRPQGGSVLNAAGVCDVRCAAGVQPAWLLLNNRAKCGES